MLTQFSTDTGSGLLDRHETHDAEVGLIHAESRESADQERAIWGEEMEVMLEEVSGAPSSLQRCARGCP